MEDRSFWIRRLHSLTGVIPIGAFLMEHMITNSKAVHGKAAYNGAVEFLLNLPYVFWLEVLFIFIPLAFHAILGIYIAVKFKPNLLAYGYLRNWMYLFQRVTGLFLVVYIALHVWGTRIQAAFDPSIKLDFFGFMVEKFQSVWFVVFQALGVLAAAFHFANGLWTFLVVWGIVVGVRAQRLTTVLCYGIGVVILIFGFDSIRGFLAAGGY